MMWFWPMLVGFAITGAIVTALVMTGYTFTAMLALIPLGIASAVSPAFFEHWAAERRHARFLAGLSKGDETPRH